MITSAPGIPKEWFSQKPVTLIANLFALEDNKKWLKPT